MPADGIQEHYADALCCSELRTVARSYVFRQAVIEGEFRKAAYHIVFGELPLHKASQAFPLALADFNRWIDRVFARDNLRVVVYNPSIKSRIMLFVYGSTTSCPKSG